MAAKRLLKSIKIDIKRSEPLIVCNGRRLVKLKYTGAWSKRKRQKSLQFVSCVLQTSPMALAPDADSEGFIKLQSSEVFRFIKGVCSGVVSSTVNSGFKMTNLCTFMFHPSERLDWSPAETRKDDRSAAASAAASQEDGCSCLRRVFEESSKNL